MWQKTLKEALLPQFAVILKVVVERFDEVQKKKSSDTRRSSRLQR
jgi:hypothetical protein